VVQRPRPPPPAIDAPIATSSTASRTPTMLGLSHRRRSSSATRLRRHRARQALARLLLRQRLDGGEIALKMAFQWWAQRGGARARLRLPARELPRRHASARSRSAASTSSTAVPAAAVRGRQAEPGRRRRPAARCDEQAACRRDRRAARAGARRDARAARGLPARGARAVRRHGVSLICDEVATASAAPADVRLRARGRRAGPACAWPRA
jgi:hypothetical protein